jgi:hypothetical protein
VDATLDVARALGGTRSQLAFTYQEAPLPPQQRRRRASWLRLPLLTDALLRVAAGRAGERFVTFFQPSEVPAWLQRHGCALLWDKRYADVAADVAPGALTREQLARLRGDDTARYHMALANITPPQPRE